MNLQNAVVIGFFSLPSAELAEQNPDAYRNAMAGAPAGAGTCAHCGTGILHHVIIEAEGRQHFIGTTCALKVGEEPVRRCVRERKTSAQVAAEVAAEYMEAENDADAMATALSVLLMERRDPADIVAREALARHHQRRGITKPITVLALEPARKLDAATVVIAPGVEPDTGCARTVIITPAVQGIRDTKRVIFDDVLFHVADCIAVNEQVCALIGTPDPMIFEPDDGQDPQPPAALDPLAPVAGDQIAFMGGQNSAEELFRCPATAVFVFESTDGREPKERVRLEPGDAWQMAVEQYQDAVTASDRLRALLDGRAKCVSVRGGMLEVERAAHVDCRMRCADDGGGIPIPPIPESGTLDATSPGGSRIVAQRETTFSTKPALHRCDDCAPEFTCWNGQSPCRKVPARGLDVQKARFVFIPDKPLPNYPVSAVVDYAEAFKLGSAAGAPADAVEWMLTQLANGAIPDVYVNGGRIISKA